MDNRLYRIGYYALTNTSLENITELLTIIMVPPPQHLNRVLRGIHSIYPGVRILVGLEPSQISEQKKSSNNNGMLHYQTIAVEGTLGSRWGQLLAAVNTPYVLVMEEILEFDGKDTDLYRLLETLSWYNVDMVGGALVYVSNSYPILST